LPPEVEGLRRLPGQERSFLVAGFRQWLTRQPVSRLVGMGAAIYLILALMAYAAFGGNACAVTVNGKVIAVAPDERSARGALDELVKLKSGQAGIPVTVVEKVSYGGIRVAENEILNQEDLKEKLVKALTFKARGTAILVNGEAKVFLKEKRDAEKLLAWLKTVYPVEEGEQLAFKEKVAVAEAPADPESILDLEAAKKMVLMGSNKIEQYTVKDGDNLWDIARALKMDIDRITLANPGLDPECLSIGQSLSLSREAPLINVVATRQVTVDEEIPYPVEVKKDNKLLAGEKVVNNKGVPGLRTVTYRITRENGLETGREILQQNIVREPETEVVTTGALTMLASRGGSVRLGRPCYGAIVSPFGSRGGRMHEGVDIGAGYGNNVVAAAGGTVINAGWEGGYGKAVEISHGGGLVTRYAHLSSINVSNGQRVERGQLIGHVGATGHATGPHLHYEVLVNGRPRNPAEYL